MKHKMKYSMPVGTSSILLIFMTLCLICFATLSLANANADYRLSKKLADHTSAYYPAANKAEAFVASSDAKLHQAYLQSKDSTSYSDLAGGRTLSCDFRISDVQSLHVVLDVIYPSQADTALYHISNWQIVTDDSGLNYDNSLNVPKSSVITK